jgi:DNA helicase HerA-like ATPase
MDSVLKVGEVCEVQGRVISVRVDKNKNLSELFYNGTIIKNVSVGGFIEIRKGFISLIGKVEGEKIIEDKNKTYSSNETIATYQRYLTISLSGFINRKNKFIGGSTELPLIGNEAYVLTSDKIRIIHNIGDVESNKSIKIAETHSDNLLISLPIDGLMNTHMAIFGNTGSGKSNTLTSIYKSAYSAIERELGQEEFKRKCKFIVFDFNGEYKSKSCITNKKFVYDLSTRDDSGKNIPLSGDGILDLEIISIISEATEKTQKPFLSRTLNKYKRAISSNDKNNYIRRILVNLVKRTFLISDKIKYATIIDYFHSILPVDNLDEDIEFNNKYSAVMYRPISNAYLSSPNNQYVTQTKIYNVINSFEFTDNKLNDFIKLMYLQLIDDITTSRAMNEHIAPVISKLKSKKDGLAKVLDFSGSNDFWKGGNFVVISLDEVNLDIKKLIPLLVSKMLYDDKKHLRENTSLNIIIDEAHNILSNESFRETESWKDHRLETFEEIIKEGRKFGVFLTISSQRPNDISNTITSQAHNYFIHRLVNERDLSAISKAVSYIDKITEESIPTLPTGVCIFSGISTQIPLKLKIKELDEVDQPNSKTFKFFSLTN